MGSAASSPSRFRSLFLVNRQKLLDPLEIAPLLAATAPPRQKLFPGGLFRVEWLRIGIVVPLYLESPFVPVLQLEPRCQFIRASEVPDLQAGQETQFTLTAIPEDAWDDPSDAELEEWLSESLRGGAIIKDLRLGPHGPLFVKRDGQRVGVRIWNFQGTLRVEQPAILAQQRNRGLGTHPELGCGLLLLGKPPQPNTTDAL